MGRLYRDDGAFGELPIGRFDSKYVEGTSVSYQNERIFCKHLVNDYKIAECRNGIIYNADGNIAMAHLHNGIVYDTDDKEIARYEGDMYGAAAAVVALILKIDAENYSNGFANESGESSVQNETSQSTSNETGGGSASSSDFNWLYMIIALPIVLIKYLLLFVWKILSFSFTSVIIAALCSLFIFDFDVFLCLIPLALNAFFLYEIREKKLISKYRGYVVAVFQNIFWVLILIPDIRQMLIRILNRYNINILGYSIPIILCVYILIPFIIALIGVRKHIKQEKLQANNKNT